MAASCCFTGVQAAAVGGRKMPACAEATRSLRALTFGAWQTRQAASPRSGRTPRPLSGLAPRPNDIVLIQDLRQHDPGIAVIADETHLHSKTVQSHPGRGQDAVCEPDLRRGTGEALAPQRTVTRPPTLRRRIYAALRGRLVSLGLHWPSASIRLPGTRRPRGSERLRPGASRRHALQPILWSRRPR